MIYSLGIDAGSTTLKLVLLDDKKTIIYQSYQKHYAKIKQLLLSELRKIEPIIKSSHLHIAFTGSTGVGYAKALQFPFVQEVFATALAVEERESTADVVIELGGEDAKIIFLTNGLEERMNSSCAGGTGAFIEQMAALLNVSLDTLDTLSLEATHIYPIASRCGVFAKSDIQPLLNQGAKVADIAASIFQAVVDQTISGLAQGRLIKGSVCFLGGPLHFYEGLRKRFVRTLNLSKETKIFPKDGQIFVSLGASLYARTTDLIIDFKALYTQIERFSPHTSNQKSLPCLFETSESYEMFKKRHRKNSVQYGDLSHYRGEAYLGIDAGSTTTKILLLSEGGDVLYEFYASNNGNPITVIREQLHKLYEAYGKSLTIKGCAVTGYGEELVKKAFHIDYGIVETLAHYTAAHHFDPKVDFILDIGGQDIKCFEVEDHRISSISLNEACSSGCGSFIESFAKQLGLTIENFVALSLYAKQPADLGSRCTVFMNSSVKEAQRNGVELSDIAAGLAISVIKNVLYKVIRIKGSDEIGKHIVVQGGTFYNDAILRSFEQEIGREVIRPNIAGLMGAYGCALYAKEHAKSRSTLLWGEELSVFEHHSSVKTCQLCTNKCTLTINHFNAGKPHISGNKCSKGAGKIENNHLPNLYAAKYDYLMQLSTNKGMHKRKIGLPLVLNMYENLPFWQSFFQALDCQIVLSGPSNKALYLKGQHTIPSDTVCYPAKLSHGHFIDLIEKKVDYIFYPSMAYNFDEKLGDNCYNCPIVAYYPEAIDANIEEMGKVTFISPVINFNYPKALAKALYAALVQCFPEMTLKHIKKAIANGFDGYRVYQHFIYRKGREALDYAKRNNYPIAVLCGRPYHVDPAINHGIDKLITSLGMVVLSEDALKPLVKKASTKILNQWTYQARMYAVADYLSDEENMYLIHLVSFSCGTDAITSDEIKRLLEQKNKLYTQLKIDETSNLGAAKIRIRSMVAAIEDREMVN